MLINKRYILLIIYSMMIQTAPVSIPNGGLGTTTVIAYGLLSTNGAGTAYQFITPGSANQFLVSTGAATLQAWGNIVPGYTANSNFFYSGSSSTVAASPNRTMIISTTTPASITSSATDDIAIGYNALNLVQSSVRCIAIGTGALQKLTSGNDNIGIGYNAANSLTTGSDNVAIGTSALFSNQTGSSNVAVGHEALYNHTGSQTVALGYQALRANTSGTGNVAAGYQALLSNQTGNNNVAVGYQALKSNVSGTDNTALGYQALLNSTGSYNVAAGYSAGSNLTSGDNNIYLGYNCQAISTTESNNIVIGNSSHTLAIMFGISGRTSSSGSSLLINSSNQLGTIISSKNFKTNIDPINQETINTINDINPVSFIYKNDETEELQYGMIAEEIKHILPETIAYDKQGEIVSIQYHKITPIMLAYAQQDAIRLDDLISQAKNALIEISQP